MMASGGFAALPDSEQVEALEQLTQLSHDVGKYVARTARNLRPGEEVPQVLCGMLASDLYELQDGARASVVFAALAAPLWQRVSDQRLGRVRELLAEADALEERVRAGDPAAVGRAAAIGCEVERLLRELVRAAREAWR